MNAAVSFPRTARVTEVARAAGKSAEAMKRLLVKLDKKCGGMLLIEGGEGVPDEVNLDVLESIKARAAQHIEERLSGVEGHVQSLDRRVASIEARIGRRA